MAIIASPADLGAVSELFDRPRAYVRFLGAELSLAGRARLLVVMPDGVGFFSPGHSPAAIDDVVGRIHVGRSGPALVRAAQAAVMFVAQADHVHLVVSGRAAGPELHPPTPWRPTTDRVFGVAVIAALAAACAGLVVFTRRRSGRSP